MRDLRIPFSVVGFCLTAAALQAQSQPRTDILTGRITDFTGHPVSDAQVGATSVGTGLTRSYLTDAEGRYKIFFPETAPQYVLLVKRMGFAPVKRTVTRRSRDAEEITTDVQFGGAPLALSMVEINASPDAPLVLDTEKHSPLDATVPNPVAEILALKDTLRLSAVQIFALTDVADTLQVKNSALYERIRLLIAKAQQAGDGHQMAGTVALMLEEASVNTQRAVAQAEKLLRPEQWLILPQAIRDQSRAESAEASRQN
jgi:carboxypeptidase family protein